MLGVQLPSTLRTQAMGKGTPQSMPSVTAEYYRWARLLALTTLLHTHTGGHVGPQSQQPESALTQAACAYRSTSQRTALHLLRYDDTNSRWCCSAAGSAASYVTQRYLRPLMPRPSPLRATVRRWVYLSLSLIKRINKNLTMSCLRRQSHKRSIRLHYHSCPTFPDKTIPHKWNR
jgi:hypothetical protein